MSRVLDDMDSRPGSTTSLLRTVTGLYLRRLGGHVSSATLVSAMADLGVPATRTRTAIVRLKQRGLLLPGDGGETDGTALAPGGPTASAGYVLNSAAIPMLRAGDRRIFRVSRMALDDPWCLISFSLPEDKRALRHQIRRRLHWIGCGTVAPGLWISPATLRGEVLEIVDDLGVGSAVAIFTATQPWTQEPLAHTVGDWWDLGAIARLHTGFLEVVAQQGLLDPLAGDRLDARAVGVDAWQRYVRGVDAWRMLPYLDPGLPAELLPDEWPGHASAAAFQDISDRFATESWHHIERIAARSATAA